MRYDLLEWRVAPLLDRVRTMAQMEQLDENKEALRLMDMIAVLDTASSGGFLVRGVQGGQEKTRSSCRNPGTGEYRAVVGDNNNVFRLMDDMHRFFTPDSLRRILSR